GLLQEAKFLILQFEISLEVVEYAMEKARGYPVQIILNPAPAISVSSGFLGKAHYLVPNETETRILTGLAVDDLSSAEKAARQFLGYGVRDVIITLGERGALLVTGHATTHVPARKVKVVDTTAAGDAFIGVLAVALAKGFSQAEAVHYAACAGTTAVTKFGAQTSLPSAEEVEALYRTT
ncbi:MAG: ribokinase, partial [Chloroflexi bacterium]|nr:ribokinase [Chloroflexota bacterium]